MQITISSPTLKLTDALHNHIESKFEKLTRINDRILSAQLNIHHEPSKADISHQAFCIKARLYIPGKDIVAEDRGHDLYQAVDLVVDRLARQLRKRKTDLTDKSRNTTREFKEKEK
ncbi:ribosomal subunit interface protein [Methylacidiphilum sp. Yel]|jgi:putative sigma-54 modulation protein|uniref:ribosome hibernation-promoting factor, HPF/YfiA family n=1 Tax=Methylacidiphilum sp. Yel TaxID=1847730 RepID=UPI00106AFB21|nr:ribosome-associated translation inhibitor RaiA [Methylacidiphilum sp. Yel]TFE69097.1 ribosomal subunit interface protein [Methylacidiphilum sp. Yel]